MNEILPADADRPRPGRQSVGTMGPSSDGHGAIPFSLSGPGGVSDGLILAVRRWDDDTAAAAEQYDADFLIVLLKESPAGPVQAPPATVICAPERPAAVRETAVAYETETSEGSALVTATQVRLLSRGDLYAPVPLTVLARDIFAGGQPRFDLLAADLLTSEALKRYSEPLALALTAPHVPADNDLAQLLGAVSALLEEAWRIYGEHQEALGEEAGKALERLADLVASEAREAFLAAALQTYPSTTALVEDVYLIRAMVERLPELLELTSIRQYVSQAVVPGTERDLLLDRTIVIGQLQCSVLVTEPQRLASARAALEDFRLRYQMRYVAHHRSYWTAMAHLRAKLVEARRHTDALERLNRLVELGPPAGEGALEAYRKLLNETSPCPLIVGVDRELDDAPTCPACRLRLDDEAPTERVAEILRRIERAGDRHMTRLSSLAVRQVLEHSNDPRIEQFLKVVQASQLSSLVEILDDALIGYLRRFLVESRIGTVLGPVLETIQAGETPRPEEAKETLREVARVLQQTIRASTRALPPPQAETKRSGAKKPRG